jgi:hypothetical protein
MLNSISADIYGSVAGSVAEFPAQRKSNGNPSRKVWPRMITRCDVPFKEAGIEQGEETQWNAAQNWSRKRQPAFSSLFFSQLHFGP